MRSARCYRRFSSQHDDRDISEHGIDAEGTESRTDQNTVCFKVPVSLMSQRFPVSVIWFAGDARSRLIDVAVVSLAGACHLRTGCKAAGSMRAPRSLCPSSLYEDGCRFSSMPTGLPSQTISLLSASPMSCFSNLAASASPSYRAAKMSCPTVQSAAAEAAQSVQPAVQQQPLTASQSCSFAAAPALCYSPAEPALKEPLGDVLRRAGKRCLGHGLCQCLMQCKSMCQRVCHRYKHSLH